MVPNGRKDIRMNRTTKKYAGEKKERLNDQQGTSLSWTNVFIAGISLIEDHGQEAIDRYTEELPTYININDDVDQILDDLPYYINLRKDPSLDEIKQAVTDIPGYVLVDEDLSGNVLVSVTEEVHRRGMNLRSEGIAWETMAQVGINSLEQRHTMDVMAADDGNLTEDDVERIVDRRIEAALEQVEGGDGLSENRVRELARLESQNMILDSVADDALDPEGPLR